MKKVLQALTVIAQVAGVTVPANAQQITTVAATAQQKEAYRASSYRAQEEAFQKLQTHTIVASIQSLLQSCHNIGFTCLTESDQNILGIKVLASLSPGQTELYNQRAKEFLFANDPSIPFTPITAEQLANFIANSVNSNIFIADKQNPKHGTLIARSASDEILTELANADPNDARAKTKALRILETIAHELGHGLSKTTITKPEFSTFTNIILNRRQQENASDIISNGIISAALGAEIGHYCLGQTASKRLRFSNFDPHHAMSTNLREHSTKLVDSFNRKGLSPEVLHNIALSADTIIHEHFQPEINTSPYPEGPVKNGYDTAMKLSINTIVHFIKDRSALNDYFNTSAMGPDEIKGFSIGLNEIRSLMEHFRPIEPDQIPDLSPTTIPNR